MPGTRPYTPPRTGRRLPGVPPAIGGWVAAALVSILLLVATVPVAAGDDQVAVVVAVLLSLAGGLALRQPVVAAIVIGVVLTVGIGHGPAHIGSGILASSIAIAACAARGHLLTSIGMAAWHLIPPTASAVIRGDEAEFVVSQVMLWIVLQTTAVLAGSWGRALGQRAGTERARRISDLAEQRRAIARELHDTGVRAMTQVVMLSENAGRRDGISSSDAIQFARISETARQATEELRDLLDSLRVQHSPGTVLSSAPGIQRADGSSPPALTDLLESLRLRLAAEGFTVRVDVAGDGARSVEPASVLGRCLREIEANVFRHGDHGHPVAVMLEIGEAAAGLWGDVDLVVSNGVTDDGVRVPQGGAGLAGMSERLASVGGRLETRCEGRTFLTHLSIPALAETIPGIPESTEAI